ncbi:ubiquitin-like-specific protease ESD4 [Pyrus ussuriensis x Pyrus communis]|uniref:Ubiquitin-like-specific protease ESD4 n=1 Tax=Pyrus ussuriensis x Pyrus communis TaxID=2448454 RepID=A0A5N5GHI0_9ROSA|nr:ubiquitin-like-specific protease ESD4 [Pyrus ussuriensis x Pyrus communis]
MNIGIELNEEYIDEMTDSEEDDQDFVTRKPRGATQLQDLVQGRSDGDRLEVGYNSKGQPCGLAGAKLASFIGVMARTTVPITIPAWKEVESSYKKKDLGHAFIVHSNSRADVLKSAAKTWRTFKSSLTLWDEFVRSRLTEKHMKSAYGITADIDRSVLWKLGRVDKKGNYTNEMVKDEVTKAVEDGTLPTSGSNDILTIALETPEYSGRVRGVGTGVSHRMYFKTPRCKTQSSQQQMMQTHLEQQSLHIEELNKKFNLIASLLTPDQLSKMQELVQYNVVQSNHISEKRAKHDDVPKFMSKKRAKQKVNKNTKTMDKIEAKKVKQKDMQEIFDLNIMEKTDKIANSNEKESDIKNHFKLRTNPPLRQRSQKQPLALRSLMLIAQNMHKDVTVPIIMESDLFGNEHTTFIGGDDIIQFCSMAEISTVCISIYIRQLWSTLKKNNLDGMFGFVDPGRISQKAGKKEQRSNALALRLQNCKKGQLIFAPYNKGFHWLLAIIDPYEELVYYMDSLNWIQIDPGMKNIVELALKMFKAQKGIKGRKNINWKVVKCPLQEGTVECGYYVMKYMKEIVDDPNCSIITKFKEKATYTQQEIDALRIEWAEYVDDFIPIDETLD